MLRRNINIGIDLGTSSVLVYQMGKGVVLKEPSVVAIEKSSNKVKAIGWEAMMMTGRTPDNIEVIRPIRQGVISDYTITEMMMHFFIRKVLGHRSYMKPVIAICVPSCVSEVEKRAVTDAAYQVGAREVFLIEEPVAAALGVGIDISKPRGTLVVDIGGGTTDVAVISLGQPVISDSVRLGGDDFDEAIFQYLKKKRNLLVGDRTAEDVKINIGNVMRRLESRTQEVCGRNLLTGYPETITVSDEEIRECLEEIVSRILETIHAVMENTPPALAADIGTRGIVMTGGGSLLEGLDDFIHMKTGINTILCESPMLSVAIGTGIFLESIVGSEEK